MIGRRVYLPELLIYHHHPVYGTGPKDSTYTERMARHTQQNPGKIYMQKFRERVAIAARLRQEITECSAAAAVASERL